MKLGFFPGGVHSGLSRGGAGGVLAIFFFYKGENATFVFFGGLSGGVLGGCTWVVLSRRGGARPPLISGMPNGILITFVFLILK